MQHWCQPKVNSQTHVKVFIGSGEVSLIERKTAIYSLRKNTKEDLDIYVFNGTHNAIELNDAEPFLAPMSLRVKYHNITEFSLYRYLIPRLCDYQGKAIYIDSDIICLTDIAELFNTPMNGADFLARRAETAGTEHWGLSVMLIDCEKCRFDLEQIIADLEAGLYSMTDFSWMSPAFLARHSYNIGELSPLWNQFDQWDEKTKLIHYTNLDTQPWRFPNHPYGELWFTYFKEAMSAGYVTANDITLSRIRGYVRRDLLDGNASYDSSGLVSQFAQPVKRILKGMAKRINIA